MPDASPAAARRRAARALALHADHACSFPPIETPHAHTLILGSMPGRDSLRATRYYAHARNAFWPIVTALLDASHVTDYDARLALLRERGYALWDVLASCTRPGSLDSAIDPASIVPNDFPAFLTHHPRVDRIFFNGSAAEALFRRHVLPSLALDRSLAFARLPSTSPAHAAKNHAAKRAEWRAILR